MVLYVKYGIYSGIPMVKSRWDGEWFGIWMPYEIWTKNVQISNGFGDNGCHFVNTIQNYTLKNVSQSGESNFNGWNKFDPNS